MEKMKIETGRGRAFDAKWTLLTQTRHGEQQLVIQLPGNTTAQEIVHDLVGNDTIKEDKGAGAYAVYEGFAQLVSIIYTSDRSAVRVTLSKP